MQEDTEELSDEDLLNRERSRVSVTVSMPYWQEKIVAALAKDSRMQALLTEKSHFYERISGICFRKAVQNLTDEERQLGKTLALAGNLGLTKRYVARISGLSYVDAQKLLNEYYAVFYRTKAWLKEVGSSQASYAVQSLIDGLTEESLVKCLSKLPHDWSYCERLIFEVPSYIYEVSVEKFFRHHFERELEINGNMIRLTANIEWRKNE